jgi:hypothetical protein
VTVLTTCTMQRSTSVLGVSTTSIISSLDDAGVTE